MKNINNNNNTILNANWHKDRLGISFTINFLPNTILTLELITKILKAFYDKVILLTDSTLKLSIYVTFPEPSNGVPCLLAYSKYVNKGVALSVLVEIIYCFRGGGKSNYFLRWESCTASYFC